MINHSHLVKQDIKLLAKTKILLNCVNIVGEFVTINSGIT